MQHIKCTMYEKETVQKYSHIYRNFDSVSDSNNHIILYVYKLRKRTTKKSSHAKPG